MKYSDNIIYFYDMKTPTGAILWFYKQKLKP